MQGATKQSVSYGSLCVQAVVTEAEAEGEEEEEETKEVEEAVVKMKMEVEKISVPKSIRGIVRWSLCPRSLCVCVCVSTDQLSQYVQTKGQSD